MSSLVRERVNDQQVDEVSDFRVHNPPLLRGTSPILGHPIPLSRYFPYFRGRGEDLDLSCPLKEMNPRLKN